MRPLSLIVLICAVAIPVAGCGGDDDDNGGGGGSGSSGASAQTDTGGGGSTSSGGGDQTLKLAADPGGALKFDKASLSAKAGKATVVMTNDSDVPHAVEVEGMGQEEEGATVQGGSGVSKVTIDLKPGKYEFYCPVDGHKAAGMKGTLTVS